MGVVVSKRGKIESSSSLFGKKGNPWLTERERAKDFEKLRYVRPPGSDEPDNPNPTTVTFFGQTITAGRRRVEPFLETVPVHESPEIDQFTKARKTNRSADLLLQPQGNPQPKKTVLTEQRRIVKVLLQRNARLKSNVKVHKDRNRKATDDLPGTPVSEKSDYQVEVVFRDGKATAIPFKRR